MFETAWPDILVGEIEDCLRGESILISRRMTAIAALLWHRTGEAEGTSSDDPGYALITGFTRTCAEVSAAMNKSVMAANKIVGQAEALATRLPEVARLLAESKTDWHTVALIITRTDLVDGELMPELDRSIAERIINWQCWSRRRIINAIDAAVQDIDPEAAKERRVTADNARHVNVTAQPNGMARLDGALPAPAAAIVDKRLSEMATSVCTHDTRTIAQRRADALVALGEGHALACNCERADCPTRVIHESPALPRFVINVIASQETLDGCSDQPGYLEGYGVIDADQVRQLAESATLRLLFKPAVTDAATLRYQPSAALERWIRCRDLMCCFPGVRPRGVVRRHRPHHPLQPHQTQRRRVDRALQQQVLLPTSPPGQDISRWSGRVAGRAVPRRDRRVDLPDGTRLPQHPRRRRTLSPDARPLRRTRATKTQPTP
jgi:hypothetical protein